MALAIMRRTTQSIKLVFAPVFSIVVFALFLSFVFLLYQHSNGPGSIQRLGWQAWDIVVFPKSSGNTQEQLPPQPLPVVPGETPGDGSKGDVDWWDVDDSPANTPNPASLPLDTWNPLLPHETGLTELAITRCLVDPMLVDWCGPDSTPADDALKGKWVRVDRDINRKTGIWWLNLYYRRTRRLDVPLITDIVLLEESKVPEHVHEWRGVPLSIRDGVRGAPALFLWYKLGPTASELSNTTSKNIIMELDVGYGEGPAWHGFKKLTPMVMDKTKKTEAVWLSYRKELTPVPRAPPLHFSHNGTFKIMQVADLHFSVSQGKCRDTDLTPCIHGDDTTASLVGRVLDAEKPDLVVFTGDQLNGQQTSWDSKSVLAKFAQEIISRKIPWAAVFGNHDTELDLDRREQMKLLQALPYSLTEPGPENVHGVGNYVLKVKSADASKTPLLTLYFLDSGSYSKGVWDWFGWIPTEYDWIHQSQIDWFLSESADIRPIRRPFSPDGGRDFSGIWARQDGPSPSEVLFSKPNALMFFHIPLQEAYASPDLDPVSNHTLDIGIQEGEQGAAKKNGGFFENALLKAQESELGGREVKVVANGHCHVAENCRRVKGVWMCFGGGGSYSGYGRVGFDRRFRIYEISEYGERIRTYKHTEHDEIIDDMYLTGKGAPPAYNGA